MSDNGFCAGLCCCVVGLAVSIPAYVVAVALSWGFAKGISDKAHLTLFPTAGAVFVTVPVFIVIAAYLLVWFFGSVCEESVAGVVTGVVGIAFPTAGVFSVIGGALLFVAAATPPPRSLYDPIGYSAFAAIAGIMAIVAGIIYCFEMCGCFVMSNSNSDAGAPSRARLVDRDYSYVLMKTSIYKCLVLQRSDSHLIGL